MHSMLLCQWGFENFQFHLGLDRTVYLRKRGVGLSFKLEKVTSKLIFPVFARDGGLHIRQV